MKVSHDLAHLHELHRHLSFLLFRHTSNNISSGISAKFLRAPRLPRVLFETEVGASVLLWLSFRGRFEGFLSASGRLYMMLYG
jgi:hypothetical protein